jgi:hypothetical protein
MFDLEQKIKYELFHSFKNQNRLIKRNTHDRMKLKIAELEAKPLEDVVYTLHKTLNNLLDNHIKSNERCAKALLFSGSGWDKEINYDQHEL